MFKAVKVQKKLNKSKITLKLKLHKIFKNLKKMLKSKNKNVYVLTVKITKITSKLKKKNAYVMNVKKMKIMFKKPKKKNAYAMNVKIKSKTKKKNAYVLNAKKKKFQLLLKFINCLEILLI